MNLNVKVKEAAVNIIATYYNSNIYENVDKQYFINVEKLLNQKYSKNVGKLIKWKFQSATQTKFRYVQFDL